MSDDIVEENDSSLWELPKGWKWVKLGDIVKKVEKISKNNDKSNFNFFYLDIGSIDNHKNKIISHKEYNLLNAPSRAQQILKFDDVLFSTVRTYLKNIAIVENSMYHEQVGSTGFTVIRANTTLILLT